MDAVNYSDLRQNLKKYLDYVYNDHEPLIVTRKNNENVVILSVDEKEVIQCAREEAQKAFERQDIRGYLQMDQDFWTNWKY